MSKTNRLCQLCQSGRCTPNEIDSRVAIIHSTVLKESPWIDEPNFSRLAADDLERLFQLYDSAFFNDGCRQAAGRDRLTFRVSSRMTRSGGKTARIAPRHRPQDPRYEIAVSSTLLFETFRDVKRTVTVTGVECRDRLEALQRIFEHEMIHLIELLVWERSSCSAARFRSMAHRFFGHTDHRHDLVTPRERASRCHGVKPGSRVRFRFDSAEYSGIVNRITKRATVLVEDNRGERYSDGRRYAKFYIPIATLEQLE